jgi:hypothetical protein
LGVRVPRCPPVNGGREWQGREKDRKTRDSDRQGDETGARPGDATAATQTRGPAERREGRTVRAARPWAGREGGARRAAGGAECWAAPGRGLGRGAARTGGGLCRR